MPVAAPAILFAPVSSPEGMGEYMRSLIIADAIKRQWPHVDIHFVLSQQAPYAQNCPYRTHYTDLSPTKHPREVNALIDDLRPDLVIFDASGRQSQLQHAHRQGAKVVFISQHDRKLSRGLKIGRLKVTDSHWVVQPEFVMAKLSWLQKAKLHWLKKAAPLYAGPVFTPVDHEAQQASLQRLGLNQGQFILFNAGSGGHRLGKELAADYFAALASRAAGQSELTMVMIYGVNYPGTPPELPGVVSVKQMANQEFINLLAAARGAVLSGGDGLLQAISLQKPTLAVPVSKDQPARIRACVRQGVILDSDTTPASLDRGMEKLLDDRECERLTTRMAQLGLHNGLETAMSEIARLLKERQSERL